MSDEMIINHDDYFNTKDIVKLSTHNRYYIKGRSDDVVLTANGEKINPDVIEEIISLPSAEHYCVLGIRENNINYLSLIIELRNPLSDLRLKKIQNEVSNNWMITIHNITTTTKVVIKALRCQHIINIIINSFK